MSYKYSSYRATELLNKSVNEQSKIIYLLVVIYVHLLVQQRRSIYVENFKLRLPKYAIGRYDGP